MSKTFLWFNAASLLLCQCAGIDEVYLSARLQLGTSVLLLLQSSVKRDSTTLMADGFRLCGNIFSFLFHSMIFYFFGRVLSSNFRFSDVLECWNFSRNDAVRPYLVAWYWTLLPIQMFLIGLQSEKTNMIIFKFCHSDHFPKDFSNLLVRQLWILKCSKAYLLMQVKESQDF